MKNIVSLLLLLFCVLLVSAQTAKIPLTHDDILKWERITEQLISNDGNTIVYKQEPWKGDPTLKISTTKGKEIASVKCGTDAQITFDSKFVIYKLVPKEDTIRQLKLRKTKDEDMPVNKLLIFNLQNLQTDTIQNLKSVNVPEEWAGWLAWQSEVLKDTINKEKKPNKEKTKGFPLFVKNLSTGEISEYPAVNEYLFAEEKQVLVFHSEGLDSTFEAGLYRIDLINNETQIITNGNEKIKQISVYKNGEKVAFLKENAENQKKDKYDLYYWDSNGEANKIVNFNEPIFPEEWEISENGRISFSENGSRIFFGTAPEKPVKDTTILEEEIPILDVWTWNENILQTQQLNNLQRDLKKSYLAVYDLNKKNAVQLETELFTGIQKIKQGNAKKLLAWSNHPYAVQTMWESSPYHNDFYLVDMQTGEANMIKKDCRATPQVSPEGNYIYWYNAMDTTWNTYNIESGKENKVTTPKIIQVADELNDIPNPPRSYGSVNWLNNDEALIVYDRYDVWKVDPENNTAPINITQNGRKQSISYRVINLEEGSGNFRSRRNEKGIDPDQPLYLTGRNEISRTDGYYVADWHKNKLPKLLYTGEFSLNRPQKAKDSDIVIFTKENFETYPNLIASDLSFKKQQQISDAAPQQKDFLWGTAELVSWTSLDGRNLEGTLHKPENFDPTKKYPMIVNFYEKSSDELYSYHMPELHRSTIDYHYYTSNGYLVFNPDVYYKTGYPGEDAFNCVMPGVTALIDKGFVEEEHVGAQGHSWGGYQVAYLATRTNLFAAIESGAPVVNMFSAYGGIRWGSGLNRSFQYEHTQSRIGKSIWEVPMRYLENSPLFTLDKINTPILIMHNDDDGAVPWYQGIEFFIGLRRLQKPAWLLNYNEADHWPLKVRDKTDFQIRMAQFFDHYLKEKPMPKWMKEGIPAVKKGIYLGYELIDNQ